MSADTGTQVHGKGPLHGLRVLDFSHYLSAATTGLVLADMGAQVVKVERCGGGDEYRRLGPAIGGVAAGFQWANRNKQGLALDLKSDPGRALALELADRADVLIENYSTGVMDRLGLGPALLMARNPRLVYTSISAYGRTGPCAARAGFDPVVQAESGLMSVTGPAGTAGSRVGSPIGDIGTGLMGAIATLGALMDRAGSGKGQHVEVSLFDSTVSLTAVPIMNFLANGVVPRATGGASREAAPVDFYDTEDGPIFIACTSNSLFERLVRSVLDTPELLRDPRFASNNLRFTHSGELRIEIERVLKRRGRAHWVDRLAAAQIPAGTLNSVPDVLASTEFTSRGLLQSGGTFEDEAVPALALPFRFSATPSVAPVRAPLEGEHSAQVLGDWLGLDPAAIERQAAQGAFGPAAGVGANAGTSHAG